MSIEKDKKVIEINSDTIGNFTKKVESLFSNDSEKFCEIRSASLKDSLCNYSYELLQGKTKGDIINRKGVHVVHEDMENCFDKFDVFLAHIDGAFKDANNQTPLEELEADEVLNKYRVTGFKITGVEENKSIILVGNKDVFYGNISFETPKIKLEGTYLYIEELTQAINNAITEVELYMDGKAAPKLEQAVMSFEEEDSLDLAGAKVQTEDEEEEE